MLSLKSLRGYSQTLSINVVGKDTNICFTIERSKFLLKKYHEVEKYKELNDVCEKQVSEFKQVNQIQEGIIKAQAKIISNDSALVKIKDYQIGGLKTELAEEQKSVRKQKAYKWVAIVAGGVGTLFFGYKFVAK